MKVLEDVVHQRESEVKEFEEQRGHIVEVQQELDSFLVNKSEIEALLQEHVSLSSETEQCVREASEFQRQIIELERYLKEPRETGVRNNGVDVSTEIKLETRKLEKEILQRDKELIGSSQRSLS